MRSGIKWRAGEMMDRNPLAEGGQQVAGMTRYLPVAVFFLALVPRLAGLGTRPFWYDEIMTQYRVAMPLAAMLRDAFANHHTPVYFLLLAPFAQLPHPEFWLRLPSAILGAFSVTLVFLIARQAGGVAAGIAAALIMGLAPTQIAYSQEARSYMLVVFCVLVALHALLGLATRIERAALPWRQGCMRQWVQFTAGSAGAVCTLGDGLPWLLAAGITAGIMIAHAHHRSGIVKNFLAAGAIILAFCLPFELAILHFEVLGVGRILDFVPAPSPALIWYDAGSLYLLRVADAVSAHFMAVRTPQALSICIGIGFCAATLAGIWRLRRDPMIAAALLPAAFTLPVLFGIISIWKPLLMVRYLLWSAPPFMILAGLGIGGALREFAPFTRAGTLAAITLLLSVNLSPFYRVETKSRWDLAAAIFAARLRPQDVVYFSESGGATTMYYYLPPNIRPWLLPDFTVTLKQAEQSRAHGKRLWVVYGDAWISRDWRSLSQFQASLAPLGSPSVQIHAGGRITMWLYDPLKS